MCFFSLETSRPFLPFSCPFGPFTVPFLPSSCPLCSFLPSLPSPWCLCKNQSHQLEHSTPSSWRHSSKRSREPSPRKRSGVDFSSLSHHLWHRGQLAFISLSVHYRQWHFAPWSCSGQISRWLLIGQDKLGWGLFWLELSNRSRAGSHSQSWIGNAWGWDKPFIDSKPKYVLLELIILSQVSLFDCCSAYS